MLKRWILAALTLALTCLLSLPALASSGQAEASELADIWETEGYPNYVGGIYYDEQSGKYTVLLQDGRGEADVRAMLRDPGDVRFVSCLYTYNELMRIQQEIIHEMETDLERGRSNIFGANIGWGNEGGFGQSGKEFRVVVDVDKHEVNTYRQKFAAKYDERVYVQAGKEYLPPVDEGLVNRWYIIGVLIIMFFPTLRLTLNAKLHPARRYKS